MHKMKTRIQNKKVIILLVIVIAAITYFSLRGCSKDVGLVYKFEKASVGEVKKTISTTGTLEMLDKHLILTKVGGIVTNVYTDFNRNVKKGQLLATLDTSEIDQQIDNIKSRKEAISLDLLSAKSDLVSKKDMLEEKLIAKKGVEQAELQYKKTETQLNQIQSEYEIAKEKKKNAYITAPASGVIINMDILQGLPVPPNRIVFEIAEDLRNMQLVVQVDESDIGSIKNDLKVTFTVSAYPDKVFEGKITQVRQNPVIKAQVVSYPVIVACDNNELMLKPGMTATATVEIAIKKNVLRVPNEAFIVSLAEIENDGKKYLWKKESLAMNSKPAKKIEVQTGLVGDYFTEIVSQKVKHGDEILTAINKNGEVKDSIR